MKRILLLFLFMAVLFNLSTAQTAMGYFDLGANLYIKGQLQQALQVVQEGLQKYPNDPYLKALAEKLKQKKQQQQQQNQQQNQQSQKKQQQKQQAQKEKQKKAQQKQKQKQKQKGQKKQMSKKEAERILQALKEENKKFKKEHLRVPAGRRQLDKQW